MARAPVLRSECAGSIPPTSQLFFSIIFLVPTYFLFKRHVSRGSLMRGIQKKYFRNFLKFVNMRIYEKNISLLLLNGNTLKLSFLGHFPSVLNPIFFQDYEFGHEESESWVLKKIWNLHNMQIWIFCRKKWFLKWKNLVFTPSRGLYFRKNIFS